MHDITGKDKISNDKNGASTEVKHVGIKIVQL